MAAIICWPIDIDMEPVPGYKAASWSQGYGDFVLKIDLSTLRRIPWLEKTALVICDIQDHHHHEDLPHSPRAMLRKQVARLKERGYIGYFASELEFYLVKESYDSARAKHWQNLNTASPYIGDYQIGITTKEETVMRRLRNEMNGCRHPDRELQGRMGPGPGRDQRALCRSAGDGRPSRRPEERGQGDRRTGRQGDHLHG
jgi:glutamine synthetase